MRKLAESRRHNLKAVWIGAAISVLFLALFFYLEDQASDLLALPVQYLIASLVPLAIGLLVGGYIQEVKAGGMALSVADNLLAEAKPVPDSGHVEPLAAGLTSDSEWQTARDAEYKRTRGYMLAHVYRRSDQPDQKFDVSVFLVRHKRDTTFPPTRNFEDVEKVEFFFGGSWGNQVFVTQGNNGVFAVRTHAWGTFLAMAKVTFKAGGDAITLFRYVDFSMAEK